MKTCEIIAKHPYNVRFHNKARVPFVHDSEGNWISYDNERSVAEKVSLNRVDQRDCSGARLSHRVTEKIISFYIQTIYKTISIHT